MLETGQSYTATCTVYNSSGQLANPATATLTITLPDGTTATPVVTLPPALTGKPSAAYVTTQAGLHKATWQTTGPVTGPSTDYFTVRQFLSVLSLAEAKAHLNITVTADDDELRNFMQAATEVIESKVGACVRRAVTERVSEGGRQLVLAQRPVLSVTSVRSTWPGGPSWTTAELNPDLEAGIVYQNLFWPFWYGPWDVSYVIGRAVIPERHLHAAKEQLRHLWETQRGAVQAPPLAGEEIFTSTTGWTFSVPRRVIELLADDAVPAILAPEGWRQLALATPVRVSHPA